MKRSLPCLILLTLIMLLFVACQSLESNLSLSTPDFEPVASTDENPTDKPTTKPESQDTAVGTKTVTPVFTPSIDQRDESMSERSADADVEFVKAVQTAGGTWTFHVTVSHPDTGWEDYADGWDVVAPDGTVLMANESDPFTRHLLHPHENEQPFTRSQGEIVIPDGVSRVSVRAHDLVDGFGGQEVLVDLTVQSGTNFEVERPTE